jgi:Holliday junction resolvase RusA-like endonuclease
MRLKGELLKRLEADGRVPAGTVRQSRTRRREFPQKSEQAMAPEPVELLRSFSCFVSGVAAAQSGSIPVPGQGKALGRTVIVSKGSKGFSGWRRTMQQTFEVAARQHGLQEPMAGPLRTKLVFIAPRLKGHPAKAEGRRWPDGWLDADKLERAVNDSLTKARVIEDDRRICVTFRVKRYALLHEMPGLLVHVWLLGANELVEIDDQNNRAACVAGRE